MPSMRDAPDVQVIAENKRKVDEAGGGGIIFLIFFLSVLLFSDRFKFERHIEGFNGVINEFRNVTDVLNTSLQSLQVVAAAPRTIREMKRGLTRLQTKN